MLKIAAIASCAALLAAGGAWAHHSFAMFDMTTAKRMTLEGTVKEFQYINPHSWVILDTADAQGRPVTWHIEAGAQNFLRRAGFTRNSLKPGDKVTVIINPLRDGRKGGNLWEVRKDGKAIGNLRRNVLPGEEP